MHWNSRTSFLSYVTLASQAATGIKPEDQRLIFQGFQLPFSRENESEGQVNHTKDSKNIEEFGIKDGSTINLLLRVQGGMPATAPRIKMPVSNLHNYLIFS
jgi:hypothetical protein